jgi:nucleotidyltransferase/DNA polymerase involved in DNA repair
MIAHIDLDSFFVSVERARNPGLAGRPIVIGGRRGGGGLVAAASREARRAGIRPGTPLVQASILCTDAVFLDGAFDVYLEAALEVDDVLRKVSSEIEWVSIDEAYIGFARAVSPPAVVEHLDATQQEVRRLGLDAAFGIGRSRTVARIASRLARPRGVLHVLDGYEARFLSPLKIEMLPDLEAPIARRLRAGGVRRLGQLATLSEPQLASLAGRAGLNLVRQATGRDSTTVRRAALQMGPIEDYRLAEPTADAAAITQAVQSCVGRLSRTLQSRRAFARSITVRMRYADGRVESRTAPLPQPSAFVDVLEAAAADLVVRLDRPGHLVRAVGVSISGLVEGSGLFPLRR